MVFPCTTSEQLLLACDQKLCFYDENILCIYYFTDDNCIDTFFVKVLQQIIQKYKLLKKILFKVKFEEKTLSFLPPSLFLSFTHTATERKTDLVLLNRRDEDWSPERDVFGKEAVPVYWASVLFRIVRYYTHQFAVLPVQPLQEIMAECRRVYYLPTWVTCCNPCPKCRLVDYLPVQATSTRG